MTKSTKTILWVVGIVVVIAIVIAITRGTSTNSGPIKIGFIGPLTGNSATFGEMMQKGLTLALNDLPAEAKSNIEIVKEDDACNAVAGLNAANKLILTDKVKYIIGPLCNESTLSSEKVFNDNGVISLTIGLPSTQIANMGPYHFSFSPEIGYLMQTVAKRMIDTGLKRMAVIHIEAPFYNENYNTFVNSFTGLGGTIVADESAIEGTSDFRTQILKMKSSNPDGLMLIAHTASLNSILKQIQVSGLDKLPKFGIHAAETPVLLSASAAAEGLIYPYPADKTVITSAKAYSDKFKAAYNSDPDPYSANVYDSLNILLGAINSCGYNNVSCVQQKFASLKDYLGANGSLSVDERGVGTYKDIMLKVFKGGQFLKLAD